MNKTELIAEVAKKCAMSKKDAEKAVSATFDTLVKRKKLMNSSVFCGYSQ